MLKGKENSWIKTFTYAWEGITWAIRWEKNMKIHLLAGLIAIILGRVLEISPLEWGFLFFAIFFVLVAELFNTALEKVVDLVTGGEYHSLAKTAKDVAAGGVLLAAINALIIGMIIFGSKILGWSWL